MRQKIRRPLTNRALTLNSEKLNNLTSNYEAKLEIIKQTIMNSWQSFYRINDFGKFKKKSTSYDLEKYKEESNQIKKDYGDSYTMTIGFQDKSMMNFTFEKDDESNPNLSFTAKKLCRKFLKDD